MPTNKAVFIIEETEIVLILKLFFYLKRSICRRYVACLISVRLDITYLLRSVTKLSRWIASRFVFISWLFQTF